MAHLEFESGPSADALAQGLTGPEALRGGMANGGAAGERAPGAAFRNRRPPRSASRTTEAWLLVAALAVVAFALALAGLQLDGAVPGTLPLYVGVLGGCALVLHLALRVLAPWADPLLLPLAVVLNGIGLTVIWGLHDAGGHAEAARQLMWTATGIGSCLLLMLLLPQPRRLQRYPYLLAAVGLVLLLLPIAPGIGIELYGARRWVAIGDYTVQPSEFAKLPLIVFLAAFLGIKRDVLSVAERQIRVRGVKVFSLPRARDLAPMTAAWGTAILVLVGTKDLGTSLLLFAVFLAMLYTATRRKSWVGIGLLMFAAGATAAWALFWHVQSRVEIWLNAFDPEVYTAESGSSHQLVQGLFALADGGTAGSGFDGARSARIFASDSDLVLISIGEVYGLTGLTAVVVLLFLLVERGFRAALGAREVFVKLLASGLAFLFAFQVFVVMGGVTRLIPLTGMTTPFLASGGSSLVSSWLVVALWLRISDAQRRPPSGGGADADATEMIPRAAGGPSGQSQ